MAEQFLHAANVCSAVEQVRSESVTERVGTGAAVEAGLAEIFFEHPADAARGEPPPKAIDEERREAPFLFERRNSPHIEPRLERLRRIRTDRCESFLFSFAANAGCRLRSQSSSLSPTTSLTRKPAEYSVSKMARSRTACGKLPRGAASSLPTSSLLKKCGSERVLRDCAAAWPGCRWASLHAGQSEKSCAATRAAARWCCWRGSIRASVKDNRAGRAS